MQKELKDNGKECFGTPAIDTIIDTATKGFHKEVLYSIVNSQIIYSHWLALSFLQEGLKKNQSVLYITTSEPNDLLSRSDTMGFNLRPFLKNNTLTLLLHKPENIADLEEQQNYFEQLSQDVEELTGTTKIDRIVIEPLDALIDSKSSNKEAWNHLNNILLKFKSTSLFISNHYDKSRKDEFSSNLYNNSSFLFELKATSQNCFDLATIKLIDNKPLPKTLSYIMSEDGICTLNNNNSKKETDSDISGSKPSHILNKYKPDLEPESVTTNKNSIIQLLLLDDDRIYGELLQEFLNPKRYRIIQCSTLESAIQKLSQTKFNLILINMNLTNEHCIVACLSIRQKQRNLPVVAFAHNLKRGADAAGILRFGADTVITQPFAFNQVKANLDAILRRPSATELHLDMDTALRVFEEEQHILKTIPDRDTQTGLHIREFFEKKVQLELEKAALGDYNFALVGYRISLKSNNGDLDSITRKIFLKLLRSNDLVYQKEPSIFFVYLEECTTLGVQSFNDRLWKTLLHSVGEKEFVFQCNVATFPIDGRSYEVLFQVASSPLYEE